MTSSSPSPSQQASPQASDGAPRSTGPTDAFHIIAIDPGLVSGIAIFTAGLDRVGTFSSSERSWLQSVAYTERWCRASNAQSLTIVSERYTLPTGRSPMSAQLEAIMCNGALEYVASQCEVTFQLQPRAEVKKVVNDTLLRKLGWYRKTKDGHANDAARHVGFALLQSHPELWLGLTHPVQ